VERWDDPSPYIGCAECGDCLVLLSSSGWMPEVPEDLEDDPQGSGVDPREFD